MALLAENDSVKINCSTESIIKPLLLFAYSSVSIMPAQVLVKSFYGQVSAWKNNYLKYPQYHAVTVMIWRGIHCA